MNGSQLDNFDKVVQPSQKRDWKRLILIVGSVIIVLVGIVIVSNIRSDYKESKNKYTYQKTDNQLLNSPEGVADISIAKPVEFKQTVDETGKDYAVKVFTHTNNQGKKLGFLSVFARKNQNADDKQRLEGMSALFALGGGEAYNKEVEALKEQVKSYIDKGYNVEFGKAQKFTNDNISKNAWVFDVTAKSRNGNPDLGELEGRFIFGASKETYYSVTFLTLASNWQDNKSVFAETIKSLSVN